MGGRQHVDPTCRDRTALVALAVGRPAAVRARASRSRGQRVVRFWPQPERPALGRSPATAWRRRLGCHGPGSGPGRAIPPRRPARPGRPGLAPHAEFERLFAPTRDLGSERTVALEAGGDELSITDPLPPRASRLDPRVAVRPSPSSASGSSRNVQSARESRSRSSAGGSFRISTFAPRSPPVAAMTGSRSERTATWSSSPTIGRAVTATTRATPTSGCEAPGQWSRRAPSPRARS